MVITRETKGELVLLGVFAFFTVAFMLDIRELPVEGKLLSYIAGPVALALMALCGVHALRADRQRSGEAAAEAAASESADETRRGRKRFAFTAGMSVFLFAAIWLVGFYLGSGLMMLVWFVCLRRVTRSTLAITVLLPFLLYVAFEILFDMSLPKGELVQLLAG